MHPSQINSKQHFSISDIQVIATKSSSSLRKEIHWSSIEPSAAGEYFCRARIMNSDSYMNKSWELKVIEPTLPSIVTSNFVSGQSQKHRLGHNVKLVCKFSGIPRPKISWYHGNNEIVSMANDLHFSLMEDNSTLSIHLNTDDEGHYRCVGENRAGRVSHEMKLIIESKINFMLLLFLILTFGKNKFDALIFRF